MKDKRIVIRCSERTWKAFKKYAVDYPSYEEALKAFLEEKGYLREGVVF
jgi:hypothetical protein